MVEAVVVSNILCTYLPYPLHSCVLEAVG